MGLTKAGGSKWHIAVLAASLAVLAVAVAIAVSAMPPAADTGTHIIPKGDMTDEEAQAMLDEQVEASRIAVSIRPRQELSADGMLHVNFAVKPPNNGYAERLAVEQDGREVYRSGAVEPGSIVTWGAADGAHAGPATATVYAVGADGADHGNPVSVEVEIVEAG